ncbi:hypothetical protein [Leucobacter chromiireducens]|uniref:Uncharacterized protein n=1 Tax=Leucobacter chromiireducens subsp. chromiireducens TaxID=660067 RepID=A0ABS1SPD1_9MICO|nr:hypothetical protein [Leucobacter chromiireducens]MBL3689435.1 hypothetical protein [Leucobacter chromiireducens subsp. chromiireducens]
MSRLGQASQRPTRSWLRGCALGALALSIGIGASGCTAAGAGDQGNEAIAAAEAGAVVATVPVSELSGVDGELNVGQEIRVLIDTPGLDWDVSSDDTKTVRVIEDAPHANPRVVRVVAEEEGSATVEFVPNASGAEDAELPSDPELLKLSVGAEAAQ